METGSVYVIRIIDSYPVGPNRGGFSQAAHKIKEYEIWGGIYHAWEKANAHRILVEKP
jgi:hypothetical protein